MFNTHHTNCDFILINIMEVSYYLFIKNLKRIKKYIYMYAENIKML